MLKKDWKKTLLDEKSSIKAAVQCLEKSALQIILVVNKRKRFIGIITDGDIRRGLLSGLNINSSIKTIINKKSFTVFKSLSQSAANRLMQINNIHQIPILNNNKKILGLYVWDEINLVEEKGNQVIVMAGGKGKRMLPYTKKCPKPLLTIGEKPILEHILLKAKKEGFNKFTFSINYLGYKIKNFFNDGNRWNVKIKYLKENFPLGTAGSLSLLKPKPRMPFIVCNGDVVSEIRFNELLDFHQKNNAIATMAVKPYELRNPYGVAIVRGNNIIELKEKPISKSYVNTGVYVFEPQVLKFLSKNKYLDMNILIQNLIKKTKKVLAFATYETWLDVGRPKDLEKAKKKNKI